MTALAGKHRDRVERSMIERVETWLGVLSFISAMLSVYFWRRAAVVPYFPDQPSLTLSWQSRLHARAGFAAAVAAFFLTLLMAAEVFDFIVGN
jgi:hypothetical protein